MNRGKLKTYAPQARRDFIQAVTDRASLYGLTKDKMEPITEQGDVAIIAGKAFPRAVAEKRGRLEERIERHGFEQVMEAIAYTWFNRLVAIRFMEIHGYLDHGYRVLSHPDPAKTIPEILEHAEHVTLPGLDNKKIIDLKLDGTKESELYRMLLIAQCNALHKAMPFLFERIADETELLLPNNLLHSDSLIRKLVGETDEEDWQQVEIIGWLYQFYISDKKAAVIGKVVKSEDIPAATQLFTPNWIVKYLVQNSLGRQWLATYPNSSLRGKMEYYIEPAEQTPEVQAQLKATTPDSLNPEELTLMDPACGSGHILVEAYDLLKEIYLERGYRLRDIPKLILTKNLFGLEIDDRAAQLAAFALMMKARADDRQVFEGDVQPNVLAIQESNGLDVNTVVQAFTETRLTKEDDLITGEFGFMATAKAPLFATENRATATSDERLAADFRALLALFVNAKTYGSLMTIPQALAGRLPSLASAVSAAMCAPSMVVQDGAKIANVFVSQALLLAAAYDAVVANPPYMGGAYLNPKLKEYARRNHADTKSDLFAMFVERLIAYAKPSGRLGLMTPFVWMFLQSYAKLRARLINDHELSSLIQPEYHAFFDSAYVPICAYVVNVTKSNLKGVFIRLTEFYGESLQPPKALEAIRNPYCTWRFTASSADFKRIPGLPIAYWVSDRMREVFQESTLLATVMTPRKGIATGDNDRFLRRWYEVSAHRTVFPESVGNAAGKWYATTKGGDFRKWYGNHEYVVNWENGGYEIKHFRNPDGSLKSRPQNTDWFFTGGITWSDITSSQNAFRQFPVGFAFEGRGPAGFFANNDFVEPVLGLLNSPIASYSIRFINPTLSLNVGEVSKLPFLPRVAEIPRLRGIVTGCIALARADWDSFETSWDFTRSPLLVRYTLLLEESYGSYACACRQQTARMKCLEEEDNRLLIEAYGLQGELTHDVPLEQVTLSANPRHRYGATLSDAELEIRFREDTIKELVSYSIGCMMGRYSLDKPGLIYANSGNEDFDSRQYRTFPADMDGIIPMTEFAWFPDSAARRFEEFVGGAWSKDHLEENLQFVADSLGPKNGEQPRDTIRRCFADDFFKDHLKTYKRRPIYWLFTSGKLGAFQCLVYLHRYNEGTLARMRTEYVIPLQGKISHRIDQLTDDIAAATSTAHRRRLVKEQELLKKHQAELLKFDEKLRHYADQRIKLDLDDGVKVNYTKFGDLLAEVKAVCGKKEDDE